MTKRQSRIFVYLFMNTVMCMCMAAAGLLVNAGFITLRTYLVALGESLVICNICSLVFRISQVCFRVSLMLTHGDTECRAFGLWNSLLNATVNSFFMNTFMTLINVGFHRVYFAAWLHGALPLELVSIVVTLLAEPWLRKLALKCRP